MTKMLRVPHEISTGDYPIDRVDVIGGPENLDIIARIGVELHSVVTLELSKANAARLHGDLTRILGLDAPAIRYHEMTLHQVVEVFRTAHPATFTIKPGVEMDRTFEIPDGSPIDMLRHIGENYGLDIRIQRFDADSGTLAYDISVKRDFGDG